MTKYAVVITESRSQDDGYNGYNTIKTDVFKEFDSEQALIEYLTEQSSMYSRDNITKIIKYEELRAETKIELK